MRSTRLASFLLLGACAAHPTPDPVEPEPHPEPAPAFVCDGTYWVETRLDLQAAALLPQPAYDIVELMRGLRDEPGRTLFDLAEQAGVPAVDEVRAALPSSLEDKVYEWIDGRLAGNAQLDRIVTIVETSIGELHLATELDVAGGAARHDLREVGFAIAGYDARVDVSGLPLVDLSATPAVTITAADGAATLALGAHAYGLPYGELLLDAVEDVVVAEYGVDLRGALGLVVDCPALAAWVADRCYLGVCVGHEAELRAICEGGLDHAAAELRARVEAIRFDAITLDAGAATLLDTDADGAADTIADGTWTAHIDAGMGPRLAPGTFTGAR